MAKSLGLILLLGIGIAAIPDVASACLIVSDGEPTLTERRAEARRIVTSATAIYDGIVVEPETDNKPAKVQVVRTHKGPAAEFVQVAEFNSCDISFRRAGERWRFVLFRGPEVYSTWVDYSYARDIDRLLRSDRRKDWPLKP